MVRDGDLLFFIALISHNRAKKETTMLIILGIAAIAAAARAIRSLRSTLTSLPRSNRDWIFY